MQLEHSFTVPVGADAAFAVLRDIERIGPCMPGATIESVEGETFSGRVKVKVGPMVVEYEGTARFVEVDEEHHRGVIEAKGDQRRGAGTAKATITAQLEEVEDGTEVRVTTDLTITGKPAQFGRGVMADVGDKLLGQFADCLAEELGGGGPAEVEEPSDEARDEERTGEAPSGNGQAAAEATAGAGSSATLGTRGDVGTVGAAQDAPAAPVGVESSGRRITTGEEPTGKERRTDDTIDLLEVAGPSVVKRFGPALLALVAALVVAWVIARRN